MNTLPETKVNAEIQTDSIDLNSLISAENIPSIRLNTLFSNVQEYFAQHETLKSEKMIHSFIIELQALSKQLVRIPVELITDDLHQAVLITNLLEELINNSQSKNTNIHILFNTSILIRECYIQSLEITKNYNQQRLELSKLLNVYDNYKQQDALRFSQEIKRLAIEQTLNDPLPEDESTGILTRILNVYDAIEKPKTFEQGTQTELTTFQINTELLKTSHTAANQLLKDELELLNEKYFGKTHNTQKRKYEVKRAYTDLSHRAYILLRDARKNKETSPQEYLNLLDDALEIQKFYIAILKQIGFLEQSLYSALQRSAQLFKQYYEAIEKTNLLAGAKEWLFSLMSSMQEQSDNLRTMRACNTIMHTSCTSNAEKMRANDTFYNLICFDGMHLSETVTDLFARSDLNTIHEILKQAIKNADWLNNAELNRMVETSAHYLITIFNHLFPETKFQNNWIFAIDLNIGNENFFNDLQDYLGTIYESDNNRNLLANALDIFHRFKLFQLNKLVNDNPALLSDKFLEFQRFTIGFRLDAYAYLLQTANYKPAANEFENLLLFSEYSSQYIYLLTKAKQAKNEITIEPQAAAEQVQSDDDSNTIAIIPKTQVLTRKTEKTKAEEQALWEELSVKYNLRQLFNFSTAWKTLKLEIKIDLEKKGHIEGLAKIEKFLDENAENALSSEDISLKYSVFDALGHQLEVYILLNDANKAWDILEEIYKYIAPHQYTCLQNIQKQQVATYTGQIYILDSKSFAKDTNEYNTLIETASEYFTEASDKAQEGQMLCYSAIVSKGVEEQDLPTIMLHWQKLTTDPKNTAPLDEYQLFYFFQLFNHIAISLINKVIPKIDKEHQIRITANKTFSIHFGQFEELDTALDIINCLERYCENEPYIRRLQANSAFQIYSLLTEIVRHAPFYDEVIKYAKLAENNAFDPNEKRSIQKKLREFKQQYRNTAGSHKIYSFFARQINTYTATAATKIQKINSEDSQSDIFNNFFNLLQETIFTKQMNYYLIVLKSQFKFDTKDIHLLEIFLDSVTKHVAMLASNAHNLFAELDNIYKLEYAKAQKNNAPTAEALENRLKLYYYFNQYLSYLKEQSIIGNYLLGLSTDFDIPLINAQQATIVPQIQILQNLLKLQINFDSSCMARHHLELPPNDDFSKIKNIKYNKRKLANDYLERVIDTFNGAHYWASVSGLKQLFIANISKEDSILVNQLIASILFRVKNLLFTDEFINIFRDKTDEDNILKIQTLLANNMLTASQNSLKKAIHDAKNLESPSLSMLEESLHAVEQDMHEFNNTLNLRII